MLLLMDKLTPLAFVLSLAGLAACSSNVETSGAGGSSSASGSGGGHVSTGSALDSTGTGTTGSPCPATEPQGGSCSAPDGFRCTFGSSVRPECRNEWLCSHGEWLSTKGQCFDPPEQDCAFSKPPTGSVCPAEGDVCPLGDDTICICSSCAGGPCMAPPAKWQCAPPPSTAGCPKVVPNDGTACSQNGLSCTYGFICSGSGAMVECKGGLWKWQQDIACAD